MPLMDELRERFDYWRPIEREAFELRNKALGRLTSRYAAIHQRRVWQNPSAAESEEFEHADAEWKRAKSAIADIISQLRAL